jgi:tetratricopeptide (TPR) repeat protein
MLSYALTDVGDVARAEQVVREALARVGDTEDPYMRVRLYWSMARVADAEGRPSVALANIRKAIALLEMTEDALNLGRAHSVAARLLVERGKADEASEQLDRAERLFGVTPSPADVVEIKIQRSRIARNTGDAEAAILFAREALAIESMPADRGYALAVLADGLALEGNTADADVAYGEAVDILEAEGRLRPAANAARAWGNMLRAGNDEERALDVLDRAADLGMRATPQHARNDR